MFTCSQAIEHARRHPVIGPLLPQEAFAAQPVPVWDAGRPAVGLLFYRISGKSGEPKTIHPPVLRALIDADGRAQEVVAAPRLWKAGERGREALGTFPGPGLRGKSRAEMDTLFHQCAEAADALLEQAKQVDGDWTRCDGLSAWRALYAVVGEEGLRPYFAGWDIPFADSDSKESELAPGAASTASTESAPANSGRETPPGGVAAPAATTEELKRRAVELAGIFDRLGKDIRDGGDEQLAAAWREVRGRFERADFTVAVAGEFNRGKTTVVNRLLGLELPVGVLPTTALMTRIGYGPEPRLHYRAPDGRRETLPLSAEAFDRFTAERMGDEAEGLLQVEVPDEWLHSRGLAFVDTPGAGDLSAARAALAARAAAAADAVMLVVAASAPGSMTERVFAEEHIFRQRVPRVAMVVTKLDQIPADERAAVVAHLRDKARSWNPHVVLWLADDDPALVGDLGVAVKGPAAMRAALEAWRLSPDHMLLRQKQMAAQIGALAELWRQTAATRADACQADRETLERERKKMRRAIEQQGGAWEDLKIEMDARGLRCAEILGKRFAEYRPQILERLQLSLNNAANPKDWWQQYLPVQLGQETRGVQTMTESALRERMRSDAAWLAQTAQARFAARLNATAGPASEGEAASTVEPANIRPEAEQLRNIRRWQTISRVGSVALSFGGYALTPFLGPMAFGLPALGGLVSELVLGREVKGQREQLSAALARVVDDAVAQAERDAGARMRSMYAQYAEALERHECDWLEAQTRALDAAHAVEDRERRDETPVWRARLAAADALLSELSALSK